MSRYTTSPIIKKIAEPRKLGTTIIPVLPISENDTFIETTSADRLDKLANTFYGDANLWWIIGVANGLGKGSLYVPPNTRLRIPINENIQEFINLFNRNR